MPVRITTPRAQASKATARPVPARMKRPTPPSPMLFLPKPKSESALRSGDQHLEHTNEHANEGQAAGPGWEHHDITSMHTCIGKSLT